MIQIVAVGSFSPSAVRRTVFFRSICPTLHLEADSISEESASTSPSSSFRPLYDGTNYTFPDTTSPGGISELLEVSFVKACMQLASGYVDVLKMFIAASVAAYESNFSLSTLQQELETCPRQTANRPLLPEEEKLRYQWLCIVYLTLALMNHPIKAENETGTAALTKNILADIPDQLRSDYEKRITTIVQANTVDRTIPSLESLQSSSFPLSEIDKAILLQSLRVATLTPVVVQESLAATDASNSGSIDLPRPPIKGAFE
jgi:hypothetical protein